ncbi:DUF1330 domain-containing protein [Advenella mimigardefordensis]|uniref:DUF1330 domain-containing protein n=1 Tax=Advenella mimigardefordensis TaxID=302406 RepID=UPI00046D41E3|nr:DUF1330 domain-containing protein [Advenella mimigardefordensis]
MPAYAVAILSETHLNDEIRAYLEQIDSTLQPFAGQFIIHGGPYFPLEGEPTADLIVVQFPDMDHASRWYASAAYQAIKPLRAANSVGAVFLVQGVPTDHRAMDILA